MTNQELTVRAVERHADLVWRLALARTGSVCDAEDVFQEVFLRHLRHGHKLSSPEHEKAWLIRCTLQRAASLHAAAHRRRELPLDAVLPPAGGEAVQPEDRAVYAAVLALPPKYRTAIHLHYYEGLTLAEIARAAGVREGTVKSWLSRGRAMLAQSLHD